MIISTGNARRLGALDVDFLFPNRSLNRPRSGFDRRSDANTLARHYSLLDDDDFAVEDHLDVVRSGRLDKPKRYLKSLNRTDGLILDDQFLAANADHLRDFLSTDNSANADATIWAPL